MPVTLPNLDDRTWQQLVAEARTLLPAYAPAWTNFNPSDPGITLIELLAWFTEHMLYRANRLGDEHTLLFLRLLEGSSRLPTTSLEAEKRRALQQLEVIGRAVTAADFETLAIASVSRSGSGSPAVARALCVPDRDLRVPDSPEDAEALGHVSVVILPISGREASPELLRRVKVTLDDARLITTHVHVVPARFVTFGVRLTLVLNDGIALQWVRDAAVNRLQNFFDPHGGGPDGRGWPFGRNVYLSDLYGLLGAIDGVDYVQSSVDDATGKEISILRVSRKEGRRLLRNGRSEVFALKLNEGELVSLELTAADITLTRKAVQR